MLDSWSLMRRGIVVQRMPLCWILCPIPITEVLAGLDRWCGTVIVRLLSESVLYIWLMMNLMYRLLRRINILVHHPRLSPDIGNWPSMIIALNRSRRHRRSVMTWICCSIPCCPWLRSPLGLYNVVHGFRISHRTKLRLQNGISRLVAHVPRVEHSLGAMKLSVGDSAFDDLYIRRFEPWKVVSSTLSRNAARFNASIDLQLDVVDAALMSAVTTERTSQCEYASASAQTALRSKAIIPSNSPAQPTQESRPKRLAIQLDRSHAIVVAP